MNIGGAAFPIQRIVDANGFEIQPYEFGLTIRDYFAAKAFERLVEAHILKTIDDLTNEDIASESYSYADAMLRRRGAAV